MSVSLRVAIRLLVGTVVLFCALVVLGGRAHATEDEQPPADQPAEAPQTDSPDASTPPPAKVDEVPTPDTPAAGTGPDDTPDPPDSDSSEPPLTNDQQADATTTGTAAANTGNNDSAANTDSNAPTTPPADPPAPTTATAGVGTGTAGSTGNDATSQIDQHATANATQDGAVDILQVGLVINVGISHGETGNNAAITGAGGPGGTGGATGQIETGDASAIGNRAGTTVNQQAVISSGETSSQIATVLNLGLAVGNTGLNIAVGTITVDGSTAAQLATLGNGLASITTGAADAIGNHANSRVVQSAAGSAGGRAVLQIGQFAIVVNFGTAFANTGGNAALAGIGPDGLTDTERAAVNALLQILGPILGGLGSPASGTTTGSSAAIITTGTASALGNDATTTVTQNVIGTATGEGLTSAMQYATVANIGVALANSGFNAALSNQGPTTQLPSAWNLAELEPAANELTNFFGLLTDLSWLSSPDPFASFARSVQLGDLTVDLGGSITGREFLVGWDDAMFPGGGPLPGGVRVRQISAVLDLALAFANSGHNLSVAVVGGNGAVTGSGVDVHQGTVSSNGTALALIRSGDATAIGSDSVVFICQAFHDDAACAPAPEPEPDIPIPTNPDPTPGVDTPPPPPETLFFVVVSPATATPAAPALTIGGTSASLADTGLSEGTLPLTGSDPKSLIAFAFGLVGAGGVLARRRNRAAR